MAGAMAGAYAGSFFGPVGTVAGGVVGGAAGYLIGSQFGGEESDNAAQGVINLQSGIQQGFTGLDSASPENKDFRKYSLEQAQAFTDQLSDRGGDTRGQKLFTLVGSRDGLRFNLTKGKGDPSQGPLTDTGSDPAVFLQTINKGILDLTEGLNKLDRHVLENVDDLSDLNAVTEALDFADMYRGLSKTAEEATAAQQAIDAVNKQFKIAKDTAKDYGLGLARLNKAQRRAIADLTEGFDEDIGLRILAITDPLNYDLQVLEDMQAARLANAEDFGADIVEVERLAALERQAVIERYAEETTASLSSSFSGFLAELTGSTQYGNSPIVSYESSSDRFNQLRRRALQGDASAEADLEAAARDFLSSSENVNARSTQYFDDRDRVIRTLRRIEADNLAPSEVARAWLKATETQTDVLRDVGTEVTVTNSRLDQALDRLDQLIWLGGEEYRASRFRKVTAAA
jgi:hypothetical protein